MNQMLNIAASTVQPGNMMPGMGNSPSGAKPPEGLFSALVSLLSGNVGTNEAASSNTPNDSSAQTSQTWLNIQAGNELLSLNTQALNSAINPQNLFGQFPQLANGLQIDQQILQKVVGQGLTGLVNTATAPDTPGQIAALGATILNIQETLQQAGTQNGLPSQAAQGNQNTARELAQANTAQLNNAQQIATQLSNTQQGLTPYSAQEQTPLRDTLASDLQRQLSGGTELNQTQKSIQNTNITNQGTPNLNNLAASQNQLPFVQTREIMTSGDPLTIAQAASQGATQSEQASMLRPLQASYPSNPINLANMAIEIVRNFNAGINRFQIRLDPPELGRIDIRMQMDDGGNLNARLTVERPDTLDFLQRDARALERALAQAGLDSSRTNLEFSLKENPFGGDSQPKRENPDGREQDKNPSSNDDNNQNDPVMDPAMIAAYKGNISPAGVSIWV